MRKKSRGFEWILCGGVQGGFGQNNVRFFVEALVDWQVFLMASLMRQIGICVNLIMRIVI